jgi:hypothetical protein
MLSTAALLILGNILTSETGLTQSVRIGTSYGRGGIGNHLTDVVGKVLVAKADSR